MVIPELDIISNMALKSWAYLNQVLKVLNEDQLSNMIEFELQGKRRVDIVSRCHQRLSVLRQAREMTEIMERVKNA